MYRSNRSFNIPPTQPGIPRAFDSFAVPGRTEFDYQSLPGGGEFDPHAFELYPRSHVKSMGSLHVASCDGVGGAVLEDFRGKDYA